MPADVPGYIFAGVVAAGGTFGYYKAGSVASLAAGLAFGTALAYGAHEVSRDPEHYSAQLAASSILAGLMGYRFYRSRKIMPAGAVCLLSIAMVIRIVSRAVELSSDISVTSA